MMYLWAGYENKKWKKPYPEPDPDPLVRGTDPDPHQDVTDPQHCLRLCAIHGYFVKLQYKKRSWWAFEKYSFKGTVAPD
jgi:hypothetical protein